MCFYHFYFYFLMKYQISPIFTTIDFYRRRFFQIVRMSNFLCIKLFLLFFVKIKIWTAQNENQSIRFNTYIHTHARTHTWCTLIYIYLKEREKHSLWHVLSEGFFFCKYIERRLVFPFCFQRNSTSFWLFFFNSSSHI